MIELWGAWVMGVIGSLHCAGMCGPLVLALPSVQSGRLGQLAGGLSYALGKTMTYALLGVMTGFIGTGAAMTGYQQTLSVAVGILLLSTVLLPKRFTAWLLTTPGQGRFYKWFRRTFQNLTGRRSGWALGALGLVNGLLPCGLVYMALGMAMVTGDPLESALFMAMFGAGTIPMLITIFMARNLMSIPRRQKMVRLVPVGMILISVLLILRGLSLGIPYVSPVAPTVSSDGTGCCY